MNHHSVRGGVNGKDKGKRERILQSAMRVFASKGFYGAKVSDIAEDAGVADGTIYLYFKSKDDLLISLFEEQMERVNAELARAMEGVRSAPEKLRSFIHAYMELVAANRHAAEVITIELRQSAKFMKEYRNPRFAEFLKALAAVIDDGQRHGTLRADIPPPIAARALFGALDELALMWVTGRGDRFDIRKIADWMSDVVLEGIAKRGDSQ
jgi:TetR/AcrR family transcriptional regulator, fatty acid metabolism regulator protein